MSDAEFATQNAERGISEADAYLPMVEEIVGLYRPPPPPPCRWGCGETMKPGASRGVFKCTECHAWRFLALWNGEWVEEADIPHLRARATANPADRYRSALREIASADLRRCSAGWLRDIAKKALGETA